MLIFFCLGKNKAAPVGSSDETSACQKHFKKKKTTTKIKNVKEECWEI